MYTIHNIIQIIQYTHYSLSTPDPNLTSKNHHPTSKITLASY